MSEVKSALSKFCLALTVVGLSNQVFGQAVLNPNQINGTIRFSPSWYSMEYRLHFTALAFMVLVLLGYYYRRYNQK